MIRYNEIKDYRYASPGFSGATGHFTQVVWKDSTKVGVGIAHSAPDGAGFITTYIVAKYTPQGNFYMRGKEAEAFQANVASRKSGGVFCTVFTRHQAQYLVLYSRTSSDHFAVLRFP